MASLCKEIYIDLQLWGGSWRSWWAIPPNTWGDIPVGNFKAFPTMHRNYNKEHSFSGAIAYGLKGKNEIW